MNLGNFEPGIDFSLDVNQMAVTFKVINTFAKRSIAHEEILTTETQRTQRDHELTTDGPAFSLQADAFEAVVG